MSTPTERSLAFAKEAASNAVLRVLLLFLLFGIAELIETSGRLILRRVIAPAPLPSGGHGVDLSDPLQLAFVMLAVAIAVLKLGAFVSMFRRRFEPIPSPPLFVGLGILGLVCRFGAYSLGLFEATWIQPTEALARWSLATAVASSVALFLETALLLGMFIAAAVASLRDRVQPEKPATYRQAPAD